MDTIMTSCNVPDQLVTRNYECPPNKFILLMMLLSLQFPRTLDHHPEEDHNILQHHLHPQIPAEKDKIIHQKENNAIN